MDKRMLAGFQIFLTFTRFWRTAEPTFNISVDGSGFVEADATTLKGARHWKVSSKSFLKVFLTDSLSVPHATKIDVDILASSEERVRELSVRGVRLDIVVEFCVCCANWAQLYRGGGCLREEDRREALRASEG